METQNIGFGFQAVELLDVVFEKSGCRDGYCQRPNIITRFFLKVSFSESGIAFDGLHHFCVAVGGVGAFLPESRQGFADTRKLKIVVSAVV